jgi:regulator of replication initiation timing
MPNHNRNSRRAVVQARHVVSEPDPVVVVASALNETGLENTNNQLRGRIKSLEKDIKAIKKTLTNQERAQEKLQFENNKLKDDLKHEHEKTIVIKSKVINNRIGDIIKEGIGLGYITGVRDDRIIWKTIYDKQGKDLTLDQLGKELFKMDAELTTMKKAFEKSLEHLRCRQDAQKGYRLSLEFIAKELGVIQIFPKDPDNPDAFGCSMDLKMIKVLKNSIWENKKLRAENEQLKKQIKEDDLLFQDVNQ